MIRNSKKILATAITLLFTCNSFSQVGINTEDPKATLHVEGDLIVKDAPQLSSATVVVINADGKIGRAVSIPSRVMFAQSTKKQEIVKDSQENKDFNTGAAFTVKWSEDEDIITNNIIQFESSDNSFIFLDDGTFEVSGYINYLPGVKDGKIGLNVSIQYAEAANKEKWYDLATTRDLWASTITDWAKTVIVAPAINKFKKGDKVRMIFKRPSATFADNHFSNRTGGIVKPDGAIFTKGMKITAL